MKKTNLSIILLILCILSIFSINEDKNKTDNKVSIVKIIPGVFQLKQNKLLKGGMFLSSFIAGISGIIINNNKGNSYYNQYLLSTETEEIVELRRKTEDKFKSRNLFIIGTSVVFLLHLFDLKFSRGKSGVKSEIKNNSINFGIYYHF